jgi:hypothetical protein
VYTQVPDEFVAAAEVVLIAEGIADCPWAFGRLKMTELGNDSASNSANATLMDFFWQRGKPQTIR